MSLTVSLIRNVDQELISHVASLEAETFGRGCLNEWHLPFIIRYGRLYVLELNNWIIGAAELIRLWDKTKDAYLVGLSIHRLFQGKKYGLQLLGKIIIDLKNSGWRHLFLTVSNENMSAIKLYKRFGFQVIDNLNNEYGQGIDRLLMRLTLMEAVVE